MASELDTLRDISSHGNLNPVQAARLQELSKEGSMGNPQGVAGNAGQYLDDQYLTQQGLIDRNTGRYMKAIDPAVKSYEASIPETQQIFQTERTRLSGESGRLQDRYKALIDDIKRNQGVAETRQTTATNAELARRGITNSSGVYGQEMTQSLNPITESYSSQLRQTGLDSEDAIAKIQGLIAGLSGQETQAVRDARNAIAQLQAGAGQSGIAQGFAQFQQNIQNALAQGQLSIQQANQALAEKQAELAKQQYSQITLPESQLSQRAAQIAIDKSLRPSGSSGSNITSLQSLLGGATTPKPTVKPSFSYGMSTVNGPVYYKY